MAEPAPQRAYQAACPGCGAPVLFRSAQSTHAVCGYCQSTVVRQGDVLARIGKLAEVFDDHSPLQLGAMGTYEGVGFVVVGRIQYRTVHGPWSEWELLQDDGQPLTLSEDNGSYVMCKPFQADRPLPIAEDLRLGSSTVFLGMVFVISLVDSVTLISAQGEIPHLPPVGEPFSWAELRGESSHGPGMVLTLEYAAEPMQVPVRVSLGKAVQLEDLKLTGLRSDVTKEEVGRQFACPSCGASISAMLDSTRRLTCSHCRALLDLTHGLGAELVMAQTEEPVRPLIALGSQAQLQGKAWQVVGFQHRMGRDTEQSSWDEDADPPEWFGWSEYLLYNRERGFQFLVDTTEGWSLVKTTTGVPKLSFDGRSATYLGLEYQKLYWYRAKTTYVVGEFYWPVARDNETNNFDFANGRNVLSKEEAGSEIVWSVGQKLEASSVAAMFKMDPAKLPEHAPSLSDAAPTTDAAGLLKTLLYLVVFVAVMIALMSLEYSDSSEESNYSSSEPRSSGGSWGGYSSGGSHK